MPTSKPNIKVVYKPTNSKEPVELPLSKSIANRLIILHAAYGQKLDLPDNLLNDDIVAMQEAVVSLHTNKPIEAKHSGTVLRFILALAANTPHFDNVIIRSEHLKTRPIEPLINIFKELGGTISINNGDIKVKGTGIIGGELTMAPQKSSQFISALMLTASLFKEGLTIKISEQQGSKSYIDLTLSVMEKAGIYVEPKTNNYQIPFQPGAILTLYDIERDWSAASFFICLSLLDGKKGIFIDDIHLNSKQAETFWCKQWIEMDIITASPKDNGLVFSKGKGSLPSIVDFNHYPDAALNVIVTFALLGHSFTAKGISTLNLKESKRLDLVKEIITQLGATVTDVATNEIAINSENIHLNKSYNFNSHNDHRMAMAVALIAVFTEVNIETPACVSKSFPYFWDEIEKLGFQFS